jgi:hypothetical protein
MSEWSDGRALRHRSARPVRLEQISAAQGPRLIFSPACTGFTCVTRLAIRLPDPTTYWNFRGGNSEMGLFDRTADSISWILGAAALEAGARRNQIR